MEHVSNPVRRRHPCALVVRAASIYQHATRERDRKIADGLSEQIKTARLSAAGRDDTEPDGHATGTGRASGARSPRSDGAFPLVRVVETRGIEPLTPALQRRCSAN